MQTRHGTMATDRPERYAKQLAGHWSTKTTAEESDGATVLRFEQGQAVELRPAADRLDLVVSVSDEGDLDRFAQVVADHLVRFGAREELSVVWEPSGSPQG